MLDWDLLYGIKLALSFFINKFIFWLFKSVMNFTSFVQDFYEQHRHHSFDWNFGETAKNGLLDGNSLFALYSIFVRVNRTYVSARLDALVLWLILYSIGWLLFRSWKGWNFINFWGAYHWVKSVHIQSYSGSYFTAFRLNTERFSVFSPNPGKYRPE